MTDIIFMLFLKTLPKLALYDTGAGRCCFKPSVFEQLKQNSLISWEPPCFNACGIGPGATKQTNNIANVNLQFETGLIFKTIPFIENEYIYDIIIGNNLVKSHRWSNYLKK